LVERKDAPNVLNLMKFRNNLADLGVLTTVTRPFSQYFSLLAGKPPAETLSPETASTATTSVTEIEKLFVIWTGPMSR
jgi:hypothetical protein